MKEQEFDKVIKQKLEAVNEAPPAYMWDKVAAGIPAVATTATTASKGFWASSKVFVVAASILLISGFSYLVFHKNTQDSINHIETTKNLLQKQNVKQVHGEVSQDYKTNEINENTKKIESSNIEIKAKSSEKPVNNQSLAKKNQETTSQAQQHIYDSLSNHNTIKLAHNVRLQQNQKINQEAKAEKKEVSFVLDESAKLTETPKVSTEEAVIVTTGTASEPEKSTLHDTKQELVLAEEPIYEMQKSEQKVETENVEEGSGVTKNSTVDKDNKDLAKETNENKTEASSLNNPKQRQINSYGIGLHYGPEFMNIDGVKLTDQAFDLSFNYQSYNFIFQTGLGLKISNDQIAYNMKYKQWDYLETQLRFDSAIIVMDQNGKPVLTPVDPYYVEVYDSLTHNYSATATEQNFILTIPLLLGYQIDYKHFAYFIKGGLRYSVIIHKNTKNLLELDENAHLMKMNYPNQHRAKSNIDYELSVGGAYKLTSQFQIQAELFGRYYHYPIYEENLPSGIHPWSLSGRIGLIYRLK